MTSNIKTKNSPKYMVLLCIIAIALNMAGVIIANVSGIPLYLDTAGTVLASALGGYMPGIITGFVTGMLRGLTDISQIYYNIVNMITAVIVAYSARRGFFKNTAKSFVTVPVLAVITGVLTTVLNLFLTGSSIGGAGADFAMYIRDNLGLSGFLSQLSADVLLSFIDKAATVAVAVILLKFVPDTLYGRFKADGWLQSGLSEDMRRAVEKSKCRVVSLRTKILLILIAATLLIAGTATTISFMLFKNSTIDEHTKLAIGITDLAAAAIDPKMVDSYIEKGDAAPGYTETEKMLYRLRDSSPDVQYIYVYKIMEDGCHVVFDLDTDEVEGSEPGDIIPFDESFSEYIPDLMAGKEVEPVISNDTFGWLLTVYKPVYDATGRCRCYAAVDISMNLLSSYGYNFMSKLITLLLGFFILVLAIGLWLIEHNIILPVNTMSYCADAFTYNSEEEREKDVERIRELNIHTGDEIEALYRAFSKTTKDSMRYVADIQKQSEMIFKMQNGLILVLADMVESRDQCTGDHIKKTAAYTKIIMEEMKKRGIYKDQLTDQFMDNVYNAAPLHDVGKIHISDAILNKPGKLTDEEFEIMKSHTTFGSEIIEKAIEMVPGSSYLHEAKNLSEYHHEKWNGKGYPHGLKGEEIPLSARIMAVADVFDALVSTRSYKKPFTFEKAMSIIKEDAGTHFDPLVAEAFLAAEDKVRKVAEEFEKNM